MSNTYELNTIEDIFSLEREVLLRFIEEMPAIHSMYDFVKSVDKGAAFGLPLIWNDDNKKHIDVILTNNSE